MEFFSWYTGLFLCCLNLHANNARLIKSSYNYIFSQRSKNPFTFSDCLPASQLPKKMWFNLFPSNSSTAHLDLSFFFLLFFLFIFIFTGHGEEGVAMTIPFCHCQGRTFTIKQRLCFHHAWECAWSQKNLRLHTRLTTGRAVCSFLLTPLSSRGVEVSYIHTPSGGKGEWLNGRYESILIHVFLWKVTKRSVIKLLTKSYVIVCSWTAFQAFCRSGIAGWPPHVRHLGPTGNIQMKNLAQRFYISFTSFMPRWQKPSS